MESIREREKKRTTASWQCVDSTVTKRGEELLQRLLAEQGRGRCGISWGMAGKWEDKKVEKWRFPATRALPRK